MKYIITESQLNLISELERNWRDFEYEEQYNKFKNIIVPYIVDEIESYSEDNNRIALYDSGGNTMMTFSIFSDGKTGDLYYDRKYDSFFEEMLPHPVWMTNGKYFISDAFESMLPEYKVFDVRSAYIA
jgi:hypothetical protein